MYASENIKYFMWKGNDYHELLTMKYYFNLWNTSGLIRKYIKLLAELLGKYTDNNKYIDFR